MQHLGEAEVAQEDCEASVQENVRGLEVSVHHFATVQVLLQPCSQPAERGVGLKNNTQGTMLHHVKHIGARVGEGGERKD